MKLKPVLASILFLFFIGSSAAWGGFGGSSFGGIGDSIESGVNDFANDVESGVEDATSEEALREYSDTAGHITGDAVREGSEFLGEAGETMYRETTDEQAQDFYKDSAEIAGEMGQEAYNEMSDEQAQEFYGQVIEDAENLGEESYEAATSEEAQQFYDDAIEGTKYASEEAYTELTDEEAQRFYREAVKTADEVGAESWEELSDEEAQKIYREAFTTVQDVGKTVEATATSDEAQMFAATTATLIEDGAEITGEEAKQFVDNTISISSYENLIENGKISEEEAKWIYQQAQERMDELGREMTDEEAQKFYSEVMQDAKFAAELSQIFGESMYEAAYGEETPDWLSEDITSETTKSGIVLIRDAYTSGEITMEEAEKSAELMKKTLENADQSLNELDSEKTEKFYKHIVEKAQQAETEISGEKGFNDALESAVFGQELSSDFDGEEAELFNSGVEEMKNRVIESELESSDARKGAKALEKTVEGGDLDLSEKEQKSLYNFAVEKAEEVKSMEPEAAARRAEDFVKWHNLESTMTENIQLEESKNLHEEIKDEIDSTEDISESVIPEDLSQQQRQNFREYIQTASDFRTKDREYTGEYSPEKVSEVYENAYDYAEGETSLPGGNSITGAFTRQSSTIFSGIFS